MFFKEDSYKNMLYRADLLKDNDVLFRRFPELKAYPAFNVSLEKLNAVKIFKFVVFLYDKYSPYLEIKDLGARRRMVAEDAGFPKLKSGNYEKPYQDVLLWKNDTVNNMALEYCRMQKSVHYTQIRMREDWLYQSYREISGYTNTLDRKRAYEQLTDMEKDLEESIKNFLNEDNHIELVRKLLESIERDRVSIRPEVIAKRLAEGNKPLDDFSIYKVKGVREEIGEEEKYES